jgi:hypothetical protein
MEGKMKELNVKWLPETFAIVSLTICAAPSAEACTTTPKEPETALYTDAPGKLIIISDGSELRANVATLQ